MKNNTSMKEFKQDKLVIKIFENRQLMGYAAAKEAIGCLKALQNKQKVINVVFAAAPSQNEFLEALINSEEVDWTKVNAFHMDEYIGLSEDAPQGFGNFLRRAVFSKLPFSSVYYIRDGNPDPGITCENYMKLLLNNMIDIVFMGIGENGHIAFNDPHVARFDDVEMVKIVELDINCRQQQVNDGCFTSLSEVPTHAITLTIPLLMSASRIFCMVPGTLKAKAVRSTISGVVDESCPASILRLHENATLYCDRDSSKLIS
jgi:glucosamine-6-phosphate deaminase